MDTNILILRVKELAKAKGVSPTRALIESGAGKDFFYNIRKGQMPSIEKVAKLAVYFDVSIDYLLGNEPKPSAPAKGFSQESIDLLARIDRLSPANRAKLSELIDLYLAAQDKKK